MVECWTCRGRGRLGFAFKVGAIPCPRCEGAKRVPAIMLEWAKAGALLRDDRRSRRMDLRKEAQRLGILPSELSNAEHGMVDPSTIKSGDT